MRIAQAKFGKRPLTGEEVRWGFENLNIDDARLKELGALGLAAADQAVLRGSRRRRRACASSSGTARSGSWSATGSPPDRALLRPIIEESAAKYAKEKGITPRDCSADSEK